MLHMLNDDGEFLNHLVLYQDFEMAVMKWMKAQVSWMAHSFIYTSVLLKIF